MQIRNANSAEEILTGFGDWGVSVGSRTGPREQRACAQQREAYIVRRWVEFFGQRDQIKFPFSIDHQDAPDFIVEEDGLEYGLEVTEACPTADGREMAETEWRGGMHAPGDHGGRSYPDRSSWYDVVADFQNSITIKAIKKYSKHPLDLIVYPNSNAVCSAKNADWNAGKEKLEKTQFVLHWIRRVFVAWDTWESLEFSAFE